MSRSDDEGGEPLFEDFSEAALLHNKDAQGKRKRDIEEKPAAKRRKLKKPKDVDDEALDAELGVNHAIAHMDPRLLADHVAQRTRRFRPEMSIVEREEVQVPEKAFLDTTSWKQPRTSDHLPDFLETFSQSRVKKKGRQLSNASVEKGHPHTLIVAASGLRAADLVRALRKFQTKEALIAKMFAKHIKLREAIETVGKARISFGVGTPQRINALLDDGALSSQHLERIVVDASHIDMKKRSILDMKETQVPLVELVVRRELKERYGEGKGAIELLVFCEVVMGDDDVVRHLRTSVLASHCEHLALDRCDNEHPY